MFSRPTYKSILTQAYFLSIFHRSLLKSFMDVSEVLYGHSILIWSCFALSCIAAMSSFPFKHLLHKYKWFMKDVFLLLNVLEQYEAVKGWKHHKILKKCTTHSRSEEIFSNWNIRFVVSYEICSLKAPFSLKYVAGSKSVRRTRREKI